MTYVFLIMVLFSNTSNMQIEPMESMEQCQAAITAVKVARDTKSWTDQLPRLNYAKCVEIKR